ncbi:hypothetical protein BUALT_Bualt14G0029000 [Buddleja alternifolia]|uniref:Uncharacterized protein n=1 Tax=Buddleja alternifolia TaxID=168488 RepID=A0AAV6WRI3_9LAMI|nr:hypothetical protein BUALT_Bualt14G0029000 [Buddleja alternifolia]
MEVSSSSVKIHSRKRKKSNELSSGSNPLAGIFTRSKSQIYFHRNRSGIARRDPVPTKPYHFRAKIEQVEDFLKINCNNASRVSSIKDLRARRVFTPDVNSVLEEEEDEKEDDDKEDNVKKSRKLLKGSDAGSVPDMDSARILESDLKVDRCEQSEAIALLETEDEPNVSENGLNLKDQPISGNESITKSKTALNMCGRRKVFKSPSSFSYRRLLPYLTGIVNDDSAVSKIEIVDAAIPIQKLDDASAEVSSISENRHTANVENVVPHSDNIMPLENEDVQRFYKSEPCNQQNLSSPENGLDHNTENTRPLEVEHNENDASRIDAVVEEEFCQTTPPDPSIVIKMEVRNGGEANNVLPENQNCKEFSVGIGSSKNIGLEQSPDAKFGTNSLNRSVLNPCSRMKVFKNPKSLSYRRLLPFLMDMSKHNSCASRIIQQPKPLADLKEDLHILSAATAERSCKNTDKFYGELHKDPIPPSDDSSPDTDASPGSAIQPSPSTNISPNGSVTSQTPTEPCMLLDLKPEEMTQSQCSPSKLELNCYPKENCSATTPSSTSNHEILNEHSPSKESGPVAKPKKCLDKGLEFYDNNIRSIEKVDVNQSSSDALVTHSNGSIKGILKRNPRGCRGLCNCLNCASFRLHADRAFEFSQNQMNDAEEIASELMKELANLRRVLEKSCANENDVIQLNPVQVKQACNRAVETENLAKERLTKLNYDLNIHCRIPALLQPKVTFANHFDEKAIPMLNPSTSAKKR